MVLVLKLLISLKLKLYAGQKEHVVHCTNRDSSSQDKYSMTVLGSPAEFIMKAAWFFCTFLGHH